MFACGPALITPVSATVAHDPYFSDVVLLLHLDGANGSTTITDSSSSLKTVTANGAAQISTARSVFGGASLRLTAYSDFLSLPNSSDFDFGTGDFTIEARCYCISTGTSGGNIFGRWGLGPTTSADFILAIAGGNLVFPINGGAVTLASPSTFPLNVYKHVAVTRSGTTFKLWLDGALQDTQTSSAAIQNTLAQPIRVGIWNDSTSSLNGYIDEIRITKGVARYTAAFTPPTSASPNA